MANNNSLTPGIDESIPSHLMSSSSGYDGSDNSGSPHSGMATANAWWNAGQVAENARQWEAQEYSNALAFKRGEYSAEKAWLRSEESAKRAYTREALQAKINREWQTELSNTAYQRATSDMLKAGINPAFAFGAGAHGASTPSGGIARSQAASSPRGQAQTAHAVSSPLQNVFQMAIGSAVSVASAVASAIRSTKAVSDIALVKTGKTLKDHKSDYLFEKAKDKQFDDFYQAALRKSGFD